MTHRYETTDAEEAALRAELDAEFATPMVLTTDTAIGWVRAHLCQRCYDEFTIISSISRREDDIDLVDVIFTIDTDEWGNFPNIFTVWIDDTGSLYGEW